MQDIRLIALDLDGTVFDDQKNISPRTLAAIRAALDAGIDVIPATGRSVTGVPKEFLHMEGVRYALTSNGASVVELTTGRPVVTLPFETEQALKVLETLRQALAANLVTMGVEAAATESLEVLVPKVLRIPQGDISAEVFLASVLPAFDVSHGFFSTGETASFDGMCTISAVCKATALRLTITGVGATTLTLTGTGWTVETAAGEEPEADTLTATYAPAGGVFRVDGQAALDGVEITGDGETAVTASIRVSAVGASGTVLPATGATELQIKYKATWSTIEAGSPTWGDLEGRTWDQMEQISKPGAG